MGSIKCSTKAITVLCLLLLFGTILTADIIPGPVEEGSTSGKKDDGYYKYSFWPMDTLSIIGVLILGIMLLLATLGGIGGSGIIIPVCLIFFRFDPRVAVAHASIFSAIGSVGRIAYEKVREGYNKDSKSMTNYHLILLSGPPSVLGAFIGTTLNKMSSEAVIMGLTFFVQIGLIYETYRMYKKKKSQESLQQGAYVKATDPVNESSDITKSALRLSDLNSAGLNPPKAIQTSILKVDFLIFSIYIVLNPVFTMIRGNKSLPSVIDNQECSPFDLYLLISYGVILLLLTFFVNELVLLRNVNRKFYRAENDLQIDTKFSLKFIPLILLVTTLGSYVSTGSSTLITLVLIWMGLSPFLASSTCLIIVIIFSGSSAAIYSLNGLIYTSCVLIGGSVVLLSTILTRMTIYQIFMKKGSASLILLFISITMLMSVPSNIYQVFPHIQQEYLKGKNIWAFKSFCPSTPTN